jgi:hypothetical protein
MYSGRTALCSSLFYAKKSGKKENIHVYMISSMKKYVNRQPVYYEYKCETGRLVLYFFSKYLIIIYDDNGIKYSLAYVNLIEKCHMLDIELEQHETKFEEYEYIFKCILQFFHF